MSKSEQPSWFSGPADGVVFAVIMVAAAFLGRENPDFVYPEVLFCFLGLLAFNLLNFSVLARFLSEARRAALAVAYNIFFLSLVLDYSGGPKSNFWVLYLLPIFNACLALSTRGVMTAAASVMTLLLVFHSTDFAELRWPELLELLIKTAIICASAIVVRSTAAREHDARLSLAAEQRRSEAEKGQAREQLLRMDRLAILGTLTAGVAHELGTPLAAILGFSQMALSQDLGPADTSRILGRIQNCTQRCRTIMQDILAFSRQKIGQRRLCDVNALLRECLELKEHDWALEGVRCEIDLAENLPRIISSPGEIQQVIFNLLTNAHQAIRSTGRDDGRIRLRSWREDEYLLVSVQDNGSGIPKEIAKQIWEPYFTTKPEGEGTGLGLAICRQIVVGQGGTLEPQPVPEGGALFLLRLPFTPKPLLPSGWPCSAAPAPRCVRGRPVERVSVPCRAAGSGNNPGPRSAGCSARG